jgi:general secretion pathway protein L
MEHLVIRVMDSGMAEWVLYTGSTRIAGSDGTERLDDIQDSLPHSPGVKREVVLVVPGVQTVISAAEVPLKQRRHLGTILPFLLEDQLAEDVGQLHFAAATPRAGQSRMQVAAARKTSVEHWVVMVKEAGFTPAVMLPETWLIPDIPESWVLLCDGEMAWLRTGHEDMFAVEKTMLADLFSLLATEQAMAVECYVAGGAKQEDTVLALMQLQQTYSELPFLFHRIRSVFELFAGEHLKRPADAPKLNLLQGAFQPPQSAAQKAGAWLPLMRVAAGWCVAMLVVTAAEAGYFSYQVAQLQGQAEAIYRERFPQDSKIIDPVQQMKAQLHMDGDGHSGFLPIVETLAQGWGTEAEVQMLSMSYQGDEHALTMSVAAPGMAAINTLTSGLAAAGVNATVVSVVSDKEGVKGQLAIKEVAP